MDNIGTRFWSIDKAQALFWISGIFIGAGMGGSLAACVSEKNRAAVNTVVDIADAACVILGEDPGEPQSVNLACTAVDAVGKIINHFTMRMPKTRAARFRASVCHVGPMPIVIDSGKPTP